MYIVATLKYERSVAEVKTATEILKSCKSIFNAQTASELNIAGGKTLHSGNTTTLGKTLHSGNTTTLFFL
jgi:hypothetical protein